MGGNQASRPRGCCLCPEPTCPGCPECLVIPGAPAVPGPRKQRRVDAERSPALLPAGGAARAGRRPSRSACPPGPCGRTPLINPGESWEGSRTCRGLGVCRTCSRQSSPVLAPGRWQEWNSQHSPPRPGLSVAGLRGGAPACGSLHPAWKALLEQYPSRSACAGGPRAAASPPAHHSTCPPSPGTGRRHSPASWPPSHRTSLTSPHQPPQPRLRLPQLVALLPSGPHSPVLMVSPGKPCPHQAWQAHARPPFLAGELIDCVVRSTATTYK